MMSGAHGPSHLIASAGARRINVVARGIVRRARARFERVDDDRLRPGEMALDQLARRLRRLGQRLRQGERVWQAFDERLLLGGHVGGHVSEERSAQVALARIYEESRPRQRTLTRWICTY